MQWTITPTWINHADGRDHPGDHAEAAFGFRYGGQYVGFCEMRRMRKGRPFLFASLRQRQGVPEIVSALAAIGGLETA